MSVTVPLEPSRSILSARSRFASPFNGAHDRVSTGRRIALAAVLSGGLAALCQWPAIGQSALYASASIAVTMLSVAVAVGVYSIRHQRRLALAIGVAGLCWSAQWLGTWDTGLWPFVGPLFNGAFYWVAAWGVLHYPERRSLVRSERALLVALLLIPLEQLLVGLFSRPEWNGYSPDVWWPSLSTSLALHSSVLQFSYWSQMALALWFAWALWRRVSRLKKIDHLITIPVTIAFSAVGLISAGSQTQLAPTNAVTQYYFLLSLLVLAVPGALLVGLLRGKLEHASVARVVHRRFAAEAAGIRGVEEVLRTALRDTTIEVYLWEPHTQTFVDAEGGVPNPQDDRRLTWNISSADGTPLALVVGDVSLGRHLDLADTALRASALALENARLHTSVLAQLDEVRRSRARIAEAGLDERRRIERDLHDGVQQRLLAIGARLGVAGRNTTEADTAEVIEKLSADVQHALRELRDLAHGIHPPELRQFGLTAAVEVVAERLPIDIEISVPDRRFSASVEATAYFIICEALVNVVKHAHASRAWVTVDVGDATMRVEIADNGRGFTEPVLHRCIAGLKDRAAALGGSLILRNRPRGGAAVEARLPC